MTRTRCMADKPRFKEIRAFSTLISLRLRYCRWLLAQPGTSCKLLSLIMGTHENFPTPSDRDVKSELEERADSVAMCLGGALGKGRVDDSVGGSSLSPNFCPVGLDRMTLSSPRVHTTLVIDSGRRAIEPRAIVGVRPARQPRRPDLQPCWRSLHKLIVNYIILPTGEGKPSCQMLNYDRSTCVLSSSPRRPAREATGTAAFWRRQRGLYLSMRQTA